MRSAFHELPTATLRSLADALRCGRLQAPVTATSLARVGVSEIPVAVISELETMVARGAAVAWGIDLLVCEREARLASRPELVWTGPEANGSGSRDTSVVVAELFGSAERSVLVATYAIHRGAEVFKVLADRMREVPGLSVRVFLNVERPYGTPPSVSDAKLLRDFAEDFVARAWPALTRLPELFYDPRALSSDPGPRACLHAKCIVVDDARAFVTSANFTEAAQERNIETGVLVNDRAFACALRDQFEALVTTGELRRVPGRI